MQKDCAVGRYTASLKIKILKNANMQNGGAVGIILGSQPCNGWINSGH